jgi:hypothetical protein
VFSKTTRRGYFKEAQEPKEEPKRYKELSVAIAVRTT